MLSLLVLMLLMLAVMLLLLPPLWRRIMRCRYTCSKRRGSAAACLRLLRRNCHDRDHHPTKEQCSSRRSHAGACESAEPSRLVLNPKYDLTWGTSKYCKLGVPKATLCVYDGAPFLV